MDIIITNLCKSYEGHPVLDHYSCTFKENKITCIMGKSGIGKTTLLSVLMGIEKAEEGTICGIEHKKISAVFQENRLFENLDAVTNIKITTGKSEEEIEHLLRELDLEEVQGKPVEEYSGGMKRRVAIARALLAEYDVLLMDEPLQGLDAQTKEKTANIIRTKTEGKTVLIVTHDEQDILLFQAECERM